MEQYYTVFYWIGIGVLLLAIAFGAFIWQQQKSTGSSEAPRSTVKHPVALNPVFIIYLSAILLAFIVIAIAYGMTKGMTV